MALVGPEYLAYVPTQVLIDKAGVDAGLDDYGAIYTVTVSSHAREITKPPRSDLDAAHWAMFLAVCAEADPDLKNLCENLGFDACWRVHRLGIESGEDAVEDARSLER